MNEKEKPFTVSDRRHFTPEGQAREGGEAKTEGVAAGGGDAQASAASGEGRAAAPGPSAGGPVDFSQFLLSLGAQAGALLSGAGGEEPAVERTAALEGARSIISILEMLRDKTEGHRTEQEERILEGLLFELRMAFVERSRAGRS